MLYMYIDRHSSSYDVQSIPEFYFIKKPQSFMNTTVHVHGSNFVQHIFGCSQFNTGFQLVSVNITNNTV